MHRPLMVCLPLLAIALGSCVSDPTATPIPSNATKLYWSLRLNHRAVTLSTVAPYDTVRLIATPLTIHATPIAGLPRPTFTSLDLEHVRVDSAGLVQAVGTGQQIGIVATLTVGDDSHSDTVLLNITDTNRAPIVKAFSIHPIPPDSAKTSLDRNITITARAMDASGNEIPGLAVYYETSDSTVATIDRTSGFLAGHHPAHCKVIATTTSYGVTKSDTLPFTIGNPVLQEIEIMPQTNANGQTIGAFVPNSFVLGPGGTVIFFNTSAPPTDVVFDNPTQVDSAAWFCIAQALTPSDCAAGNIAAFTQDHRDTLTANSIYRARSFPVPGTYKFHSKFGTTGSIIVTDTLVK